MGIGGNLGVLTFLTGFQIVPFCLLVPPPPPGRGIQCCQFLDLSSVLLSLLPFTPHPGGDPHRPAHLLFSTNQKCWRPSILTVCFPVPMHV